ncbi:hypothetical protein [Egibacter rhizosphaerae]|nr:hypothetical protein [Egibacter rhizosphaerae]
MKGKASFDDVYDQPDPRAFAQALAPLDYQIPEHGRAVFRRLVEVLRERDEGQPFSLVDLCTSYGVNPALLNHEVVLAELYARYRSPELADLATEDLQLADKRFFADRRRADAVHAIGLDVAANAIQYADRVGLLDVAAAENLEERDPSPELARALADARLVTVTGGMSYVTAATFDRVLGAARVAEPPWVAAFALRGVDMRPIEEALQRHGLVTERFTPRTFPQRRFASDHEQEQVLTHLRDQGIDPDGVESDGFLHAWLYVARPRSAVDEQPLEGLLAGLEDEAGPR